MFNFKEIAPSIYLIPKEGKMRVPGLVVATPKLLEELEIEKPLEQVRNVAELPGIIGYSIAMPDIHWGYGFPIGGVAAMDEKEGVISPGGVGYDINCGVRLALTPYLFDELSDEIKDRLIHEIFREVPSGVGRGHKGMRLTDSDYKKLLEKGARWAIEEGYGLPEDLNHIESLGCIEGAKFECVSEVAKARGKDQLGTLGSGNHFIELGFIEKIFLPECASEWGVKEGQLYILIHTGSRGFGHQVCQDTLDLFMSRGFAKGLPDSQLVAAPLNSEEGRNYFAAMAAAANFAFNNRQEILHYVRNAFSIVLGTPQKDIRLLYDVCHNIAKFEKHIVDGKEKRLCIHRKGATRAFGPGAEELPSLYKKTGQPVIIPGDMARASYLCVGQGNPLTWCSASHGAGRAHSRIQSMKKWKRGNPIQTMRDQGVTVLAASFGTIAEEMPDAYKDVDLVVEATQRANLALQVARLKPRLVIKG